MTPTGHGDASGSGRGPHALVADVERPELTDDDRHHLSRVLRLAPGDPLTVGDGAGAWRECRMGAELQPVGPVQRSSPPDRPITVGFALIKGSRPEMVVQKLTEIGVDRIVPFVAERSVVRWDPEKRRRQAERMRRVAREAVMQCRRAWLPEVCPAVDFAELTEAHVALAEPGGPPLTAVLPTVLVGPEGGWSDSERAAVSDRVGLGPQVMRADTAAIVAGALLVDRRGGWG
ncbi:MAG: RsmE family RNA methyltransferase [Acidimicrobiales bacterium]